MTPQEARAGLVWLLSSHVDAVLDGDAPSAGDCLTGWIPVVRGLRPEWGPDEAEAAVWAVVAMVGSTARPRGRLARPAVHELATRMALAAIHGAVGDPAALDGVQGWRAASGG